MFDEMDVKKALEQLKAAKPDLMPKPVKFELPVDSVDYDSPITMYTMQDTIAEIARKEHDAQMTAMCTYVQRYGFDIDKETLEQALTADIRRYGEAYQRGYSAGVAASKQNVEDAFDKGFKAGYELNLAREAYLNGEEEDDDISE